MKNIEITNRKIIECANVINGLVNKSLPVRASYALAKNIDILNHEIKYYNSEKDKLLQKYGKKDEKGDLILDKSHNVELEDNTAFYQDLKELLDIKTSLNIYMITLENLDNTQFTPQEITALHFMIENY